MENPTPFDLNEAIRRWQQNLGSSPAFKADNLEELTSHLRASVQKLHATGLSEEEAFLIAARRLGDRRSLEQEFDKVNPEVAWSLPGLLFWAVTGIFLVRVISSVSASVRQYERVFEGARWQRYSVFDSLFISIGGYDMAVLLVIVLAFLLCWRLLTGSWKNFDEAAVRQIEGFVSTKLIRTTLGLVGLALLSPSLPAISALLAVRMGTTGHHIQIIWRDLAAKVEGNVVLALIMILLARWGLRKLPSVDGAIHNRATRNARS